jgi:phage shock protein C
VVGGVCAGIARSASLDPLLLRVAVVAVTLLTGGAGLLAYLAAWVLIPREDVAPPAPDVAATDAPAGTAPAPVDVRAAWSTAGNDLRSLAGELRRSPTTPPTDTGAASPGTTDPAPAAEPPDGAVPTGTGMPDANGPATDVPPGAVPSPRSPVEAADDAATALGERLRAPEVQEGARRAAASVSQALAASVDELGRRVRRDRS